MITLEGVVQEFNKILQPPLYSEYIDVIDMYASAQIKEKRVPCVDPSVANLKLVNNRLIIKVLRKKWFEKLNAAVFSLEKSFPALSVSWET